MSLWSKSNAKVSSRRQIQIKEVKDGILALPGEEYRMILEISPVNFELKSEEEQDVLIDTFQNFINALPSPIQVVTRVREVNIDHYLEQTIKLKQTEKEKVYKDQVDNYCSFIKELVADNKILSRRFYVVIPYKHQEKDKDFATVKQQMHLSRDIVQKGLEKIGLKAKVLDSLEVLNLFFEFYNPNQVKTQELNEAAVKAGSKTEEGRVYV